MLPQLGSVALQAGEHAGENIARLVAGKEPKPFEYRDKGTMAAIARGAAVAQMHGGRTMKGEMAFLAWGAVHLTLLSAWEDRTKAMVDWTWGGFSHERPGQDPRGREGELMAEGTADVLVVFGITGDLAKVMTFRSLYRLEQRGLLDCPIVGVAVDDWTVDQLRERARESIEGTGEQLDDAGVRPLRRPALLRRTATSATPPRTSASARRSRAPSARSSTSRSRRSCSARWSRGSPTPA